MRPQPAAATILMLVLGNGIAAGQCAPSWSATSAPGTNGNVSALAAFGGSLYVAGAFSSAGGSPAVNIARWNGATWSAAGAGLPGPGLWALKVVDLGQGPALYSGGFTVFGGSGLNRWDGSAWTAIGMPVPASWVGGLGVFDEGQGPRLIASGGFTDYMIKWDGSAWSALGGGGTTLGWDYQVFDDGGGSGRALYITGDFGASIDLVPGTGGIMRWDGHAWSSVGGGLAINTGSRALAVFDDGAGGGPALYVAGDFFRAGLLSVNRIARWDGRGWSALGAGLNAKAYALAVFDDGGGPGLYAAGAFTAAGGQPAAHIARWRGGAWSALGAGLSDTGSALAVFDPDGPGPAPAALYVGGAFMSAGGLAAAHIAAWTACPEAACYANCDASTLPPVLNVNDFACFLNKYAAGDPYANCDGSTVPPVLNVNDFQCFLNSYAAGCP